MANKKKLYLLQSPILVEQHSHHDRKNKIKPLTYATFVNGSTDFTSFIIATQTNDI